MSVNKEISRLFVLGIASILSIFLVYRFPSEGLFEGLLMYFFFFFVFPLSCIRFVLREKLSSFGFIWTHKKKDYLWFFGLLSLSMLSFFLILSLFEKQTTAIPPSVVLSSFWLFFLFFFLVGGGIAFFYEVFFRGFIQLGVQKKLGFWAIFFQWIAFFIFISITGDLFFQNGDFNWSSLPLLISSFFSGILVYKTQSLFFSFVFSWSFGILVSVIALLLSRI